MEQAGKRSGTTSTTTIELDISDTFTQHCRLDLDEQVVGEERVRRRNTKLQEEHQASAAVQRTLAWTGVIEIGRLPLDQASPRTARPRGNRRQPVAGQADRATASQARPH